MIILLLWGLYHVVLAEINVGARTCDQDHFKNLPFCNTTLDHVDRVRNFVSLISESDKLTQFGNKANAMASVGVPAYNWWSEALHGVFTNGATSFPQVCALGASYNRSLWALVSTAIGNEARACYNTKSCQSGRASGGTFWAPNINIFRDPRWGRGQETVGEDPFVTSEYAAIFVANFQDTPDDGGADPNHLKASACCKHYFDYNLENWGGVDRYHFDAIQSQQDLEETFLPAFESCVRRGHASGIMCSYNSVNGIPSCANKEYMNQLARKEWGFNGYITSDCGAVTDVYTAHKFTKTPSETLVATLDAGMDIDCGKFFNQHLQGAVSNGSVTEEMMDTALFHLFDVRFRLGEFDPLSATPYSKITASVINSPAHQKLALEAAQQAIILLKNEGSALPLTDDHSVAVIGPHAKATVAMQGNYYGKAPFLISPFDGIKSYAKNVTFAEGCNVECKSTGGFEEAIQIAKTADVAVVIVGLDGSQEKEAKDRVHLVLPGYQNDLVSEVASAAKQTVVVLMTGGPVDIEDIKKNDKIHAIIVMGYPGEQGGQGLADNLYGIVNPSGRLTTTVYPESFTNVSMFTMDMRPNSTTGYPGRTYKFYAAGDEVYTFGEGLSYTTFKLTALTENLVFIREVLSDALTESPDEPISKVSIVVKNIGKRAGADTALAFAVPPNKNPNSPTKILFGFQKVFLQPGESKKIDFDISAKALSLVNEVGERRIAAGRWRISVGVPEDVSIDVQVLSKVL